MLARSGGRAGAKSEWRQTGGRRGLSAICWSPRQGGSRGFPWISNANAGADARGLRGALQGATAEADLGPRGPAAEANAEANGFPGAPSERARPPISRSIFQFKNKWKTISQSVLNWFEIGLKSEESFSNRIDFEKIGFSVFHRT